MADAINPQPNEADAALDAELHQQSHEAQVGRGRVPRKLKATSLRSKANSPMKIQKLHDAFHVAMHEALRKAHATSKLVRERAQEMLQQISRAQQAIPDLLTQVPEGLRPIFTALLEILTSIRGSVETQLQRGSRQARLISSMGGSFVAAGNNIVTMRQQYGDIINQVNLLRASGEMLSRDVTSNGRSIADLVLRMDTLAESLPIRRYGSPSSPRYSPTPTASEGQGEAMEEDDTLGLTEEQRLASLDPGIQADIRAGTHPRDVTMAAPRHDAFALPGPLRNVFEEPTTQLPPDHMWLKNPLDGDWLIYNTKTLRSKTQAQFFAVQHDEHPSGSKVSVRMPQPQKFSGDNSTEDLDEALFAFENYLRGTNTHPSQWSVVAMPLLTGSALRAYTNMAQPMSVSGITPTWEEFKEVLQPFARLDKRITARQSLYSIKQTKSVSEYHQRFTLLVSRAGAPTPTEQDLLMLYWNGLSDDAKRSSKLDPLTSLFWTSFSALTKHTLNIALSNAVSGSSRDQKDTHKRRWHDKLSLRAMQTKRPRSDGYGGNGNGGGRGGRGGRTGRSGRGGRGRGRDDNDGGGWQQQRHQKKHDASHEGDPGSGDEWCNDKRHGTMRHGHKKKDCHFRKDSTTN